MSKQILFQSDFPSNLSQDDIIKQVAKEAIIADQFSREGIQNILPNFDFENAIVRYRIVRDDKFAFFDSIADVMENCLITDYRHFGNACFAILIQPFRPGAKSGYHAGMGLRLKWESECLCLISSHFQVELHLKRDGCNTNVK